MEEIISRLMNDFGLAREQVGDALGINRHLWLLLLDLIYHPWPAWIDKRLVQLLGARIAILLELDLRLQSTFESESVKDWLYQPNPDMAGRMPIIEIRKGKIDNVFAALESLDSGVYI